MGRWERGDVSAAGFDRALELAPLLEGSRLNWLADAEVSFRTDGPGLGLSWFFTDPFEREAFFEAYPIPLNVVRVEERMRERFELAPRAWIKADVIGGQVRGYSQYFVVDSRLENPLSTLRLGLRALGAKDVSRLEPVFESVLGRPDCLWAMIGKWGASGLSPRFSGFVPRDTLAQLFGRLVENGFLSSAVAEKYVETNEAMMAGESAYLSLDLGRVDAATLDFISVEASSVPEACRPYWGEGKDSRRYLKFRWHPGDEAPAWSVYRSLPDVLRLQSLVRSEREAFREAADYYEENCAAIVENYGATYQAGSPTEGSMSQHLVVIAEIKPGMSIVDAGCGASGPAVEIASLVPGLSILGFTASGRQARAGSRHIQDRGKQGEVLTSVADYHQMPIQSDSVDRVLFLESLGYASLQTVIDEAARVLKRGGKVYVKEPLVRDGVVTSAEAYELAEFDRTYAQRTPTVADVRGSLEKAGLKVTLCRSFGQHLTAERFTGAMFGPNGLNEFGKAHYRAFKSLPIDFYELVAEKSS